MQPKRSGLIDVWAQVTTERFMRSPWLDSLVRWTGISREPTDAQATLEAMDAAGVAVSLLSAWRGPTGDLVSNDEVAAVVAAHPDRFAGLASVDLDNPVQAVRELRRCVQSLGFVGVRVVPWLWNLPPNDRRYYPIYVACVELGIPFCTQVGHTGPLCRSEPGRPIPYLDDVLLDFPDLVVVGGHVGYPWMDEIYSLAHKYRNFHIDTSAYVVRRLPPSVLEFMRGAGRTRVLFGTNWPMLSPARCLDGLSDLSLGSEVEDLFLGGNARRVFRLP
jgi:predicted TIM-barrel fold metal-dependent hydrolase